MHPNPIFRQTEAARSLEFACKVGFGQLMISTEHVPLVANIPFLLIEGEDNREIELHLVRSNPIALLLKKSPRPAKLAVTGPHSYVSPDWYGVADQVPTWNYIAVHLSGTLRMLDQTKLPDVLDRISDHFEAQLAPKPIWKTSKMDVGVLQRMMRQIIPCRLKLDDIESTWKLNQNKADAIRLAAADGVAAHGIGSETRALASLMRNTRSVKP